MKNAIPFLLIAIIFSACHKKTAINNEPTTTVITGKVSNPNVYPHTKTFTLNITDFRGKKTIICDSVNSDGTFSFAFDLYKAQDLSIDPIVGKIIAHPGDSIHLNIDFADIGHVRFSGDAQQSNMDLYKYLNGNYCIFSFSNREKNTMSFIAYKTFCDSVKLIADEKQHEFVQEVNPTTDVDNWTKDYIELSYIQSLLDFPFYYAYVRGLDSYYDISVPNNYYRFLDGIETKFSESVINTNLYTLANVYTGNFTRSTITDTTLSRDSTILQVLNELIDKHEESYFKQVLLGNCFYQFLNTNDVNSFDKHKDLLDKNIHESSIKDPLISYYNKLQKQLAHPEINSDATLAKLNGKAGKSLIDSIWATNRGKVIYIDFWATWCAPCKAEMPNSKKLKKMMVGKDVEFVYICLNSTEQQWELTISQMKLDGKHYYCNREQSKSIRQSFDIDGVPHYMLVDKKGNIIEAGSYLRPMNTETIKKIEKLLTN